MKQKDGTFKSSYARMYMVTPEIYEKLLECIDESDTTKVKTLNKPQPTSQIPSLAHIAKKALPRSQTGEEVSTHTVQSEVNPIGFSHTGMQTDPPFTEISHTGMQTEPLSSTPGQTMSSKYIQTYPIRMGDYASTKVTPSKSIQSTGTQAGTPFSSFANTGMQTTDSFPLDSPFLIGLYDQISRMQEEIKRLKKEKSIPSEESVLLPKASDLFEFKDEPMLEIAESKKRKREDATQTPKVKRANISLEEPDVFQRRKEDEGIKEWLEKFRNKKELEKSFYKKFKKVIKFPNKYETLKEETEEELMQVFKCPYCKSAFTSDEVLSLHITKHHPRRKKYKCELCGLPFDVKKEYQVHFSQNHASKISTRGKRKLQGMPKKIPEKIRLIE